MTSRRQFLGASFAALVQPEQANPRIKAARDAALAVLKPAGRTSSTGSSCTRIRSSSSLTASLRAA